MQQQNNQVTKTLFLLSLFAVVVSGFCSGLAFAHYEYVDSVVWLGIALLNALGLVRT